MASEEQHPSDETVRQSDPPANAADGDGPGETYAFRDLPSSWSESHPVAAAEPVRPPAERRRPTPRTGSFWFLMGCNLLVFVSSACVMILELTASRLIAKHVGNSLYTWTSVIGVVLAGITIGNYTGGWLADRFNPRKTLPRLFLLASVLCFSVLWLDQVASGLERGGIDWPMWVLSIVAGMFLLPSIALGTISPVVASLALSRNVRTGITVGNVYAWGALGSIIGTFLAGFYLIDLFGTKAIIALTSGSLAGMGIIVAGGQRAFRAAVLLGWLQFVAIVGLAATARADTPWIHSTVAGPLHDLGLALNLRADRPGEYHDESNYSYISIGETNIDGETVKYLKLDKLIHSYYNPEQPDELYYDYERIYAAVTLQAVRESERLSADPSQVSTFFMGGGGFVFPRWIEAHFPQADRIDVAELDPAVIRAVRQELGLPPDDRTPIDPYTGDARNFVDDRLQANQRLAEQGRDPVRYEFIYGDAFSDFSIPFHLTTLEYNKKLRRLLTEDGCFLANVIDIYPRTLLPRDWPDQEKTTARESARPRFVFGGPVPGELFPADRTAAETGTWSPCPAPFGALEIRRTFRVRGSRTVPQGYELAVRGAMTEALRRRLRELGPDQPQFLAAVDELYHSSRREPAGRFLASYANTLAEVFPNLYIFSSEEETQPKTIRDTYVIVASSRPLDLQDGATDQDDWQGRPFAWLETPDRNSDRPSRNGQMQALLALARGTILTDDFAPVDKLLSPVFVRQE